MTAPGGPDYALLDASGQSASIFFPRRDVTSPPPGSADVQLPVEPGVAVAARWYAFDPGAPTVLYFHGNGEVASDHDDIAPLYKNIGLNLFVAEFRGYGASNGHPSIANLVSDAHPVVERFHELLDEQGFAAERYVMGRSLGSHPALEIAANLDERFRGLIIESGAANLRRMALRMGVDPEDGAEGQALVEAHEAKIRGIRLPVLILHGQRDDLVPLETAVQLNDLLEGTERELVVIPGAGHNDILFVGYQQYFDSIAQFVERTR